MDRASPDHCHVIPNKCRSQARAIEDNFSHCSVACKQVGEALRMWFDCLKGSSGTPPVELICVTSSPKCPTRGSLHCNLHGQLPGLASTTKLQPTRKNSSRIRLGLSAWTAASLTSIHLCNQQSDYLGNSTVKLIEFCNYASQYD